MRHQPILDLPLNHVLRQQIALPLQQVFHLHTLGSFLHAWHDPEMQDEISQLFDSPEQARQAVAVCANWLGLPLTPVTLAEKSMPWWCDAPPQG